MDMLVYFIGVVLCISLVAFILLYISKLWQIKRNLEKFLYDLKNLDKQFHILESVAQSGDENMKDKRKNPVHICENCQNLRTYVPAKSDRIFVFRCVLHSRDVNVDETCGDFKKDLMKWRI